MCYTFQVEFEYKKSLGQNFIYDMNYLRALVKKLNVQPTDVVVEVGTGMGTLTQALAETGCQVYALEVDKRLQPHLEQRLQAFANVHLTFADALKYDFSQLPKFRLIANVPYYITTPLIMQFLGLPNCLEVNVLIADEVAKRIVEAPGSALYGALSVSCQLQADCEILQFVPRTLFTPQPKVDSAFVCLKKNGQPYDSSLNTLLKGIFAGRRKTILNTLSRVLNVEKKVCEQILQDAGVDVGLRAEQIAPTKYAEICAISHKYHAINLL